MSFRRHIRQWLDDPNLGYKIMAWVLIIAATGTTIYFINSMRNEPTPVTTEATTDGLAQDSTTSASVWTDPQTGVEYITVTDAFDTTLTPRLDTDGEPMVDPDWRPSD